MKEKDESKENKSSQSRVERLIELFKSLEGRQNVFRNRTKKGIPEGFGWRESEEEYQKTQQEWLRQVEEKNSGIPDQNKKS